MKLFITGCVISICLESVIIIIIKFFDHRAISIWSSFFYVDIIIVHIISIILKVQNKFKAFNKKNYYYYLLDSFSNPNEKFAIVYF